MGKDIDTGKLTVDEERFCELYVYGDREFAGQVVKCYVEVFGETKNISVISRRFIEQVHIANYINELMKKLQSENETLAVKLQVTETLKGVMLETSTAQYCDKFGVSLSPAPLRAVSVNAAKAIMDLYPIKIAHESKMKIEGAGSGFTFNVIVPENEKDQNQS